MGWRGGWGIRRRDLGPKEKEPPQVQDEEVAADTPNSDESGKEKLADEIANETNGNGELKGFQTEKS